MSTLVHTLHIILAGVWLGGIVFTMAVVSPALKAMKWSESERVSVRSTIGKQYARVGTTNLVLLLIFAVLDGLLQGFGPVFYAEYALLVVVFGLVAVHGAYFGRKLASLADAERRAESPEETATLAARRRALQRISSKVSWLDLVKRGSRGPRHKRIGPGRYPGYHRHSTVVGHSGRPPICSGPRRRWTVR